MTFTRKQVEDAINVQFELSGEGARDCRDWGAMKLDAVTKAVDHLVEEDRKNRPILIGSHPFDVKDVLARDKLIHAITHERVAILDIIRAAQGKLSENNPARTVLQVLDGVIASRQHGDETRVKELA